MVGMNKHRFDLGTNFFNFDRRKKRKEELSSSYRNIYISNSGHLNFYFYIIPSFSLQYSFFFFLLFVITKI